MNEIILAIISVIGSGGLAVLVTVKFIRQKASADAMSAVQSVYQATIKDLREDKEIIKKEFADFKQEVKDKFAEMERDVKYFKSHSCQNLDCKLRKKCTQTINNQ